MSSCSSALPLPAIVPEAARKAKVEHERNSEAALVKRCQAGDQMAFREILERHQSKVFSIIYGIVRHRNDAEDIAQQVFTKVYFSIGGFDLRSSLLTWIYKITINECYNHLRKHRPYRTLCVSEMTEAEAHEVENARAVDPAPDRQAEMAQMVSFLLGKVSPEERLLLLMKEVEGYSIQDLSRLFDCNENTIKVKLFRARQRLAQLARRRLPRRK